MKSWLNREIVFSQKKLHILAYLLLFVPYYLFIFTHLKLIYSLPIGLLLTVGLYFLFRHEDREEKIHITYGTLIFLCVAALLVVIVCGQGGYLPQKFDHHWRNAILYDLVSSPWPVQYHTTIPGKAAYLVYYYNYWLFPALIGKIFLPLGIDIAVEVSFAVLVFLSVAYIVTIVLVLAGILNKFRFLNIAVLLLVLFLFSGMDLIGYCIAKKDAQVLFFLDRSSIDFWSCFFYARQYNSILLQLGWVYNQALPAWLCTSLFLREKGPERYGVITAGCLVCAPFPCTGLACLALFSTIAVLVKLIWTHDAKLKEYFLGIFSWENILTVLAILPVLLLFFLSNQSVASSSMVSTSVGVHHPFWILNNWNSWLSYIVFIFLECGLLALVLQYYNRSVPFFTAMLLLLLLPTVYIVSYDFWSRASIPPLFILTFYCIKFYLNDFSRLKKSDRFCFAVITLVLFIGVATPTHELFLVLHDIQNKFYRATEIGSFSNLFGREKSPVQFKDMKQTNFVSFSADKSFFFSHLAKKSSGYADSKDNRKVRSLLSEQPENENLLKGKNTPQVYIGQYLNWIYIIATEKQSQNMTFSLCSANADSDVFAKVDKLKEECFTIQNMQNNTGRDFCIPCCISTLPGDGFLVILLDGNKSGTVDIPPECKDQVSLYLPEEQVVILNIKMLNEISQSSPDRRMGLYKW